MKKKLDLFTMREKLDVLLHRIEVWATNCGRYEFEHRVFESDIESAEYHRGGKEAFLRVADELREVLK